MNYDFINEKFVVRNILPFGSTIRRLYLSSDYLGAMKS